MIDITEAYLHYTLILLLSFWYQDKYIVLYFPLLLCVNIVCVHQSNSWELQSAMCAH